MNSSSDNIGVTGIIHVHKDVLTAIARKTACCIPGVVRLDAGAGFMGGLRELVGSGKNEGKAIAVSVDERTQKVTVDLKFVLEYGKYASDVAAAVQKAIYHEITALTGMKVNCVNVFITDIDSAVEEKTDEEEKGEGE